MDRRILAMVGGIALVISACSSSGGGGSSAAASAAGAPSAAASGAACAEASGNGTVAVSVKDFSFEPSTINAKVGETITFSNTGNAPHNATLDAGGGATPTISPGKSDGLTFTAPGAYPFHCSIPPQMKGTITVGACPRHPSGALDHEERGTRRQIDEGRSRQIGGGEPGQELVAGRECCPLVEFVQLDARDELAVPGPEFLALARQRPVEHDQTATRVERRPGSSQDRRRVGQLMQGVLEVRQVVLADLAGVGRASLANGDSVAQPCGFDGGPGTSDRVLLEFDADELERRETSRHRDEPAPATAVDVDDATAT